MINANDPCLVARAAACARYEGPEEIWQHYTKSKRGYFLAAFLGLRFWLYALFTAFAVSLLLLDYDFFTATQLWRGLAYFFVGIGPTAYLIELLLKIWFWQYSRHVIVTNHGIWIMWYSTLWWSAGFDGKKHLFSPDWNLYAWEELHGVFPLQSPVSRLCGLQDLAIDRWDGEEIVRYLTKEQVAQICEYATKCIPAHKRQKQRPPKPTAWRYIWEGLWGGNRKRRR